MPGNSGNDMSHKANRHHTSLLSSSPKSVPSSKSLWKMLEAAVQGDGAVILVPDL